MTLLLITCNVGNGDAPQLVLYVMWLSFFRTILLLL